MPSTAQPASEAPTAPASLIEDAFQATSRAAPVSESRPALARAPLPPRRPTEADDEAPLPPEAVTGLPTADPAPADAPFAEAPRRREPGRLFSEKQNPIGRAAYLPIIRRMAVEARVPIDLADAVATIESAYDPHAVGASEEIGLMQVREQMSKAQGFEGSAQDL
ncbi:MAG: transglycosylase SLT domain-containing protein, partial [Alphaproteobacteria bacterium]